MCFLSSERSLCAPLFGFSGLLFSNLLPKSFSRLGLSPHAPSGLLCRGCPANPGRAISSPLSPISHSGPRFSPSVPLEGNRLNSLTHAEEPLSRTESTQPCRPPRHAKAEAHTRGGWLFGTFLSPFPVEPFPPLSCRASSGPLLRLQSPAFFARFTYVTSFLCGLP